MKKMKFSLCLILLTLVFFGCTSTEPVSEGEVRAITDVKPGESIVIIQRVENFLGGALDMKIWVNDIEVASARNGERCFAIIPNGEHKIQAISGKREGGNIIEFTVNNEEINFLAHPVWGAVIHKFHLTEIGKEGISYAEN